MVRIRTKDGHGVAVNPANVLAVTPATDPKGVQLVGACIVHLVGGMAFLADGPVGALAQALEGGRRIETL